MNQAKKAGTAASDEDSEDDDVEYDDYDQDECEALPVNDIDVYVTFAEMLRNAQSTIPLRFQVRR